ncbi:MAG: hypothetical protein WA633_18285 [Stellaceae bacterium]
MRLDRHCRIVQHDRQDRDAAAHRRLEIEPGHAKGGVAHEVDTEFVGRSDLGGNYANIARDLGGWSERVEDPAQIGDAILRARRQTEDGRAALLEFMTSQEQGFSHRRGAAE